MKFLKVAVPVAVALVLLAVATGPAAAQAPACAFDQVQLQNLWATPPGCPEPTPWQGIWGHDRYPWPFIAQAGTNEDPFGGFAINSVQGDSSKDGNLTGSGSTSSRGPGIVEKFGVYGPNGEPFGTTADQINGPRPDIRGAALPGGVPSRKSGDGSSPRKAINISGAWAVPADPRFASTEPHIGETPNEIPTCWTGKIPAGTSKWFKMETWKNKMLEIWVDDELDTATRPSGSAVFGAADQYTIGTAPSSIWLKNAYQTKGPNTMEGSVSSVIQRFNTERSIGLDIEGYVGLVYDPDSLRPDFAWEPPNAAILVRNVGGSGSLSRGPSWGDGSQRKIQVINGAKNTDGNHGFMSYNPNHPFHLLEHEAVYDGWVYLRVYNQMLWDGTATVCSYRAFWK